MQQPFFTSDWGALLVAAPFLVLLVAGFLHLDSHFSERRPSHPAQPSTGIDRDGNFFFTDPDGRPWFSPRRRNPQ